ncbi:MAG: carboxypeptidase-like regulatory domain-containing protein [Acidobacteriota bacterium]|nr:carboxypeptidase-like regulatory domain-containing protein [Acidobacteriota bacterium]
MSKNSAEYFRLLLFCSVALITVIRPLPAQVDQGAIRGTVQDASGAVVPDAKVTLTNEDTGLLLQTNTSASGSYSFSPIKIGTYTASVERTGFSTVSHPHISIHASEQAQADFSLMPGNVNQTIEVSSGLPLLQTQSSEVGQDLTSRQVNDLPLNGRNYTFLAQVSAGVTQMQTGRAAGTGAFTANGLPSSHNSYLLDGIDNNNNNNNNTIDFLNGNSFVVLTPPDAIQEVNVQTSNFPAEYGRTGSAVINATTKSGTNTYQGVLWEYLRNDALDASTWSANRSGTPKPELRQNPIRLYGRGPDRS